jgi:hypothetical protein
MVAEGAAGMVADGAAGMVADGAAGMVAEGAAGIGASQADVKQAGAARGQLLSSRPLEKIALQRRSFLTIEAFPAHANLHMLQQGDRLVEVAGVNVEAMAPMEVHELLRSQRPPFPHHAPAPMLGKLVNRLPVAPPYFRWTHASNDFMGWRLEREEQEREYMHWSLMRGQRRKRKRKRAFTAQGSAEQDSSREQRIQEEQQRGVLEQLHAWNQLDEGSSNGQPAGHAAALYYDRLEHEQGMRFVAVNGSQRKKRSRTTAAVAGEPTLGVNGNTIGRWSEVEHMRFMQAVHEHGKMWSKVANAVATRTSVQCRTHAQKCLPPDFRAGMNFTSILT